MSLFKTQPSTHENRNTNQDGDATATTVFNGIGSSAAPSSSYTVSTPTQPANQLRGNKVRDLEVVENDSSSEEGCDGNDDADNEDDSDPSDEGDADDNPEDGEEDEDMNAENSDDDEVDNDEEQYDNQKENCLLGELSYDGVRSITGSKKRKGKERLGSGSSDKTTKEIQSYNRIAGYQFDMHGSMHPMKKRGKRLKRKPVAGQTEMPDENDVRPLAKHGKFN
jgi:hypothetical protein